MNLLARLCHDFIQRYNTVQDMDRDVCGAINDIKSIEIKDIVAVFMTDVAGVYDRPPQNPGAKLIKEILIYPDGSVRF